MQIAEGSIKNAQRKYSQREIRAKADQRAHEGDQPGLIKGFPQAFFNDENTDGRTCDDNRGAAGRNRSLQRRALFEHQAIGPIVDFLPDGLFAGLGQLDQLGKPQLLILPHAIMRIDVLRHPRGIQSRLERHLLRGVEIVVDEINARRRDRDRDRDGEPDRANQFSEWDRPYHSATGRISVSRSAFKPCGDRKKSINRWASALLARAPTKYKCLANR
jgi:hypothetical protein